MKRFLTLYFTKWWRPILAFVIVYAIYLFGLYAQIRLIAINFDWILLLISISVLISSIWLLVIKKWYWSILQIGTTICLLYFLSFYLLFYPTDFYADNLEIPSDIELNRPLDLSKRDSIRSQPRVTPDLVLYSSFQPGLYEYDAWIENTDNGEIFLKAYEITKDDRLSSERLSQRTKVNVKGFRDTIVLNGSTDYFTIYEGDFGKPYAARFELWFKNEEGDEIRILDRNYIIEGWMR